MNTPRKANGRKKNNRARKPKQNSQHTITFDDNRLLPALFGEHDRNLAVIEDALGVEMTSRGNHVVIAGAAGERRIAEQALRHLYRRLEDGGEIDQGELAGAVRMATVPDSSSAQGTARDSGAINTGKRSISPRSQTQRTYIDALRANTLTFGTGPAGTGKTYLAVAMAAHALNEGRVDRIILSRPAVEAGEQLGFLPGDLREKIDPYLRPLFDALYDVLPASRVARGLEDGTIEIAPLAFMRGRTLAHAFIILDEAQNCTSMQMRMFLTRLGENSRMAVTGDLSQTDLPAGVTPGLSEAVAMLGHIEEVTHVAFGSADVVRSTLVTEIVRAYDRFDARKNEKTRKASGVREKK